MNSLILKSLALFIIPYFSREAQAASFEGDDPVTILNDVNFYKEINEKQFMLVMFYAPWCDYCTQSKPEVIAAAEELLKDDPPAHIGVMDADGQK